MNVIGQKNMSRSLSEGCSLFYERCFYCTLVACLLVVGMALSGCRTEPSQEPSSSVTAEAADSPALPESQTQMEAEVKEAVQSEATFDFRPGKEVGLFDGETLGLWKVTDFGGQGDVHVEDEAIYLEMGSYTTGITWSGPVVRMNYEISLEAMRVDGTDFFCALTFPVNENPCTLVLGGWGGTLCGLSNIGFYDASENETTTFYSFKNKVWYHVRLRVLPDQILAWLDGEELVNVETTGKKIDIRPEMDLCQPLGIATWVTTGAVRNIYLTKLPEAID